MSQQPQVLDPTELAILGNCNISLSNNNIRLSRGLLDRESRLLRQINLHTAFLVTLILMHEVLRRYRGAALLQTNVYSLEL
jgi:hypothetical protein